MEVKDRGATREPKNYRNFEKDESNFVKELCQIMDEKSGEAFKKLDKFVVLSEEDRVNWSELQNVKVISNPLPFNPEHSAT